MSEDSAYRVCEADGKGRICTAKRPLPPETDVLTTQPYAFALFDSFRKRVCAACLLYNEDGVWNLRCVPCDQLYLCSAKCQTRLIASAHHLVCPALKRLASFKGNSHEKSVIKILLMTMFRRFAEAGGLLPPLPLSSVLRDSLAETNKPTSTQVPEQSDFEYPESPQTDVTPFWVPSRSHFPQSNSESQSVDKNSPDDELTWSSMILLESHYSDWPVSDVRDWRKTKAFLVKLLLDCELFLESDIESAKLMTLATSASGGAMVSEIAKMEKLGDFCLDLVSRIESNAFGLWNAKGICMGRAVFPIASFFNVMSSNSFFKIILTVKKHSCDPNCESVQSKTKLTIRTTREVNQGQFTI
ncbi:hypothetical protein HK096_006176 [Nowakowskiella sp. JEL0078]|nr:hypothetical protein HK096_006176 [Nowakowskiella sp. JEL0078]